jgi:hypothetical protein
MLINFRMSLLEIKKSETIDMPGFKQFSIKQKM